ncbi:MAG: hypothetical protein ACI9SY_000197 [Candidatus Paceibacteria bacterium]|jgi:hypothetical protein
MDNRSLFYSGLVWLVAASALGIYALAGVLGLPAPGVEQLVGWLGQVDGCWILLAAFLSIFIEGLYFFGSFLPGSTLVVVVAILAQLQSWLVFALTIFSIFLGWVMSGVVNIVFATRVRNAIRKDVDPDFIIEDRALETWFPSFRANYEVSQIISGGQPWKVFWSSVRVKVWGSIGATGYVLLLPFIVDVTELQNNEGFLVMFLVAAIMVVVGVVQVYESRKIRE